MKYFVMIGVLALCGCAGQERDSTTTPNVPDAVAVEATAAPDVGASTGVIAPNLPTATPIPTPEPTFAPAPTEVPTPTSGEVKSQVLSNLASRIEAASSKEECDQIKLDIQVLQYESNDIRFKRQLRRLELQANQKKMDLHVRWLRGY